MINDENKALTNGELFFVRHFLKMSKHACLYFIDEHPYGFKVLNYVLDDNGQF